jgi:allophanate hydrolase
VTEEDQLSAAYARLREAEDSAIAISVLDEDAARAKLGALDRDLPLFGVPFMVKDNIDVAGLPTTAACPSFAYVPTRSAAAVGRLEAAGAVAIAKTNLDQFATGLVGTRSPYGTPRHPTDPALVPGGSSSGSAVAVARGIVPFSIGTDTAGSGRVPASLCGIVGLKPTRGWISARGVVPAVASLDCVSVFAPSVETCWQVTGIAAGFDAEDPHSRHRPHGLGVPARPFRVGVAGGLDLAGRADRVVSEVTDVDLSPFLAAGDLLYGGPWLAERYAAVGEFVTDAPDADPVVREIILAGAEWSAVEAARAKEHLARLRRATEPTWAEVDVIVLPTTPSHPTLTQVAADPVGVNTELGRFTSFVNLLDLCAVALPGNISVLAPAWADNIVATVAAALAGESWSPAVHADQEVELAVVGAHLRGQPLHGQLSALGARLVATAKTAPAYRLYALAGQTPPKPGLVRVADGGSSIEVEVYALPVAAFGRFTSSVPAPLCIGAVELADARVVRGFLCEPTGLVGATDITAFGGWRAYRESVVRP